MHVQVWGRTIALLAVPCLVSGLCLLWWIGLAPADLDSFNIGKATAGFSAVDEHPEFQTRPPPSSAFRNLSGRVPPPPLCAVTKRVVASNSLAAGLRLSEAARLSAVRIRNPARLERVVCALQNPTKPITVIVTGGSNTDGRNVPPHMFYTALLEQWLNKEFMLPAVAGNHTVIKNGMGGTGSCAWALQFGASIRPLIAKHDPALLVFEHGFNDGSGGNHVPGCIEALARLTFRSSNASLLFLDMFHQTDAHVDQTLVEAEDSAPFCAPSPRPDVASMTNMSQRLSLVEAWARDGLARNVPEWSGVMHRPTYDCLGLPSLDMQRLGDAYVEAHGALTGGNHLVASGLLLSAALIVDAIIKANDALLSGGGLMQLRAESSAPKHFFLGNQVALSDFPPPLFIEDEAQYETVWMFRSGKLETMQVFFPPPGTCENQMMGLCNQLDEFNHTRTWALCHTVWPGICRPSGLHFVSNLTTCPKGTGSLDSFLDATRPADLLKMEGEVEAPRNFKLLLGFIHGLGFGSLVVRTTFLHPSSGAVLQSRTSLVHGGWDSKGVTITVKEEVLSGFLFQSQEEAKTLALPVTMASTGLFLVKVRIAISPCLAESDSATNAQLNLGVKDAECTGNCSATYRKVQITQLLMTHLLTHNTNRSKNEVNYLQTTP